jgi:hypothetical protein
VAARHAVLPHSNGALSRRPLGINPLQNPFGKDHGVCNDRMQRRRWPGALQLAELAGCQDRSHDPDHALAALIHNRILKHVRLIFASIPAHQLRVIPDRVSQLL